MEEVAEALGAEVDVAAAPRTDVAGFWRRIGAGLLDGVLLGAAGLVVGYVLFDVFVRMGVWGRLIGFATQLGYFGLLNSSFGGGQTLGKRALGIKVVDAAGGLLTPRQGVVRAAVFALPFTLNGVDVPPHAPLASVLELVVNLVAVAGMGAIAYLFVANRRTRQSLHDLVVGSFVVRADAYAPVTARTWRGHFAVVALGCEGILALGMGVAAPSEGRRAALYQAHRAMEELPLVRSAAVFAGTQRYLDSDETRYVKVHVLLSHDPADREATAAVFAREIMAKLAEAREADQVVVVLTYGYDIGIARWTETTTHTWTPAAVPPAGPPV